MKKYILTLSLLIFSLLTKSQIVSQISAEYHDGQIFITWNNVVNHDTGFYYVYKNSVPITDSNFQTSAYLGRVPFNFSYDFRASYSIADSSHTHYFLITNDTPYTVVDTFHNLFVLNCTQAGAQDYFAVRCGCADSAVYHFVADSNATSAGVTEQLDPIKSYLLQGNIKFPGSKNGERMDAYIHYGSNIATGSYPAMVNEGCLPFHFGIIKVGAVGANNAFFLKFHGGKGNFVNNVITAHILNAWKVSFDDWIPAYGFDSSGYNSRWFGYNEYFDIYKDDKNTTPPDSGVIRAYTYRRVKWEVSWIKHHWPNTLDSTRQYLVGSSQGCAAVLIHSLIDPGEWASGSLSDGKFYVAAPNDENPECKYNDTGSARKESRVLWGNEDSTNLYTDIPVAPGSSQCFRIYDLSNMNFMLHNRRNETIPFIKAINGKTDINTCWCEKISVYDSVQSTHAGGIFYWDLRAHGGGQNNSWPPLDIPSMQRFKINQSFPALSYTSLDGNPGDATVVDSPYYNGDNVGALHAGIDWVDSSIVDSSYFWQIQLFCYQNLLNDNSLIPAVLPENASTDVTIRRAQRFKGFEEGTHLCWLNFYHGELIQSGTVTQEMDDTDAKPITIPRVKVFPDGSLLRVVRCDSLQPTGMLPMENYLKQVDQPSFIVSDESLAWNAANELGEETELLTQLGEINPAQKESARDASNLQQGIYFLRVKTSQGISMIKVVKI